MCAARASTQYNATLIHRIDITPQLAIFQVKPDGEVMDFKPGQFCVLGLFHEAPRIPESEPMEIPDGKERVLIRRAYSISSGSQRKEFIEFYISLVTSGGLTPRLFHLQKGGRLFMGPKAAGLFTLDLVTPGKNILMVATGTGLAPYMSVMRTQILGEGCSVRPMAILQGAAFSWDLGYRSELEAMNRQCPKFQYLPVVSRPEQDTAWRGRTGRLTGWLERRDELSDACGFPIHPDETHVFLCGNPGMVDDASVLLEGQGYVVGTRTEPGTLHREKYW
jgi:ferredoxin--NADP+ reductase